MGIFFLLLSWTFLEPCYSYEFVASGFCPGRFVALGQRCYWFSDDYVRSWDEAMEKCNKKESALTSIETDYESFLINHYIREYNITNKYFWIGANIRGGSQWEWAGTGKNLEYLNWCFNEPNNRDGTEFCVILWKVQCQLCWNDTKCEKKNPYFSYICERGFV